MIITEPSALPVKKDMAPLSTSTCRSGRQVSLWRQGHARYPGGMRRLKLPQLRIRAARETPVPRKAHLLLIDDDPNTLASLARAFRLAGHEATVCDNALRAMELLREAHFDLILSDVVMPGKSGLELLEELKKAGVPTPVVLIDRESGG